MIIKIDLLGIKVVKVAAAKRCGTWSDVFSIIFGLDKDTWKENLPVTLPKNVWGSNVILIFEEKTEGIIRINK